MSHRFRFRAFSLFLLASLGASLLVTTSSVASSEPLTPPRNIPDTIVSCLPKTMKDGRILAAAKEGGTTYYLVHGTSKLGEKAPFLLGDFLVSTDKTGCAPLNAPERASTLFQTSLATYVTKPIARNLALSHWKVEISLFPSKEALERALREGVKEGPDRTFLFPEDVWALKKLGIDLSDIIPEY